MSRTSIDLAAPIFRLDATSSAAVEDAPTALDVALSGGATDESADAAAGPIRTADLNSAIEAQRRANATPGLRQLRRKVEERVPGRQERSPSGAPTLPAAAGGKGGLFSKEAKENAARALKEEPAPDLSNPYAAEKADTRRALDQLGLRRVGGDHLYLNDSEPEHAAETTRAMAGKTSLAEGADVSTKIAGRPLSPLPMGQPQPVPPQPSVDELVTDAARGQVGVVADVREEIAGARAAAIQKNDGKKTFMAMPWGTSLDSSATDIAARMAAAEPGTPLHEEATKVLGHAPTRTPREGGFELKREEINKLKADLIVPKLRTAMADPQLQADLARERGLLEAEVAAARKAGVMPSESAGNSFDKATAIGDPTLALSPTDGIKGLFRVGATKANGKGTADDDLAAFSSPGQITASAPGVDIPVGVDKNGKAFNVDGTSFSAPIMAETAYVMSSINPKLSIDQIEKLLTDPRVARDIPGSDRDGAGVVDPFAAALLARNPKLTRPQIDHIRETLDANPTVQYDLIGARLVAR